MKFVIDLDGTLCFQKNIKTYCEASPILNMINKVNKLYDEGHYIEIFTARGMNTYGSVEIIKKSGLVKLTEKWLKDNNVKYHSLKFGKPSADFYVDDKNMNLKDFLKY